MATQEFKVGNEEFGESMWKNKFLLWWEAEDYIPQRREGGCCVFVKCEDVEVATTLKPSLSISQKKHCHFVVPAPPHNTIRPIRLTGSTSFWQVVLLWHLASRGFQCGLLSVNLLHDTNAAHGRVCGRRPLRRWSSPLSTDPSSGLDEGLEAAAERRDLCLEAASARPPTEQHSRHTGVSTPPLMLCAPFFCFNLCVKGDASKSGSEIDLCAQSMEDVNGSKKDLSASAGESPPAREVPRLCFNQSGMPRIKTPSLCNLSEAPLQTLGKTGTICLLS